FHRMVGRRVPVAVGFVWLPVGYVNVAVGALLINIHLCGDQADQFVPSNTRTRTRSFCPAGKFIVGVQLPLVEVVFCVISPESNIIRLFASLLTWIWNRRN